MTKEEAKTRLKRIYNDFDGTVDDCHAISMAIKALSQEPKEWSEMLVMCDNCGHAIHVKNEDYEQEPCDDVVSRQAVMDCYKKWQPYYFEQELSKLPSVKPQEKTGHWIKHPEIETSTPEYLMFYECSECGNKQCFYKADTHRRNYCGTCGARMESEE